MSDSTEISLENRFTRKRRNDDTSCPDDYIPDEIDVTSDLLNLPDLAMQKIFSFLSVEDLKNVRLVSSRLSGEVLKLEKRLRTWTIEIGDCQSPPPDIDKVFQYNIFIQLQMNFLKNVQPGCYDLEDFDVLEVNKEVFNKLQGWLRKYSSFISGLKLKNIPQKVVTLILLELKQVRNLEFENEYKLEFLYYSDQEDALLSLLTKFGDQLEGLSVKLWAYAYHRNENNCSSFSLSNLKHLDLDCKNVITSSFLKILPATLESLSLSIAEDFELPSTMNQMNKLKTLKVGTTIYDDYHDIIMPDLTTMLLSTSLTRLQLQNVDLRDQELVDKDFPSLKFMHLRCCNIDMSLWKRLLMMSAESLKELILNNLDIENYEDFDISLPVVTTLELDNFERLSDWLPQLISKCSKSLTTLKLVNVYSGSQVQLDSCLSVLTTLELNQVRKISWLPKLLSKCSETLTTLKLSFVDECALGHLASDFPVLKKLTIIKSGLNINHLLSKCSSSLQMLHMNFMHGVKFEVNVPNLVELQLYNIRADGFTNLVSPHGSRVETIGLNKVDGSIWEDIMRCRFEHLQVLYLPLEEQDYMREPRSVYEEHLEALKKTIITVDVKVIKDWKSWARRVNPYFNIGY